MNVKTWIPLAIAVVLGLIAAKVARDSMNRNRGSGQGQTVKHVKIVVARVSVSPGQELTADMLTLGPIASETPPSKSFIDAAPVVGRVAAAPLFPGQPVTEDLLAVKGAGSGLQALVPRGMRAITVDVTETTGLAGMILPGCRVDVVSTLSGATRAETVACTIVQDVLVQAIGQRLSAARSGEERGGPADVVKTVTLIATPREAEAIELASSMGRTRLVLRGPDDRAATETQGITLAELLGDDTARTQVVKVPTPPTTRPGGTHVEPGTADSDPFAGVTDPPAQPKPRRTVTLIRGGTRTEVTFEMGHGETPRISATHGEPAVTRTPQDSVGQ
jgi:pilus assembly protein CpaB